MKTLKPHRLALAVAGLMLTLAATGGHAAVTVTGGYHFDPGGSLPIGPGDLIEPTRTLWIGTGAGNGSFAALAGSKVDLGALFISASGSTGGVLLDGSGTVLTLYRDSSGSRLEVGNFGNASLTVSGGALLDARSAPCVNGYCGSVVANSAGSTALLRVTGSGSAASFAGNLTVGNAGIDNRYDFGRPGLAANGRVEVLEGAQLTAGSAAIGVVYPSPYGGNGQERGFGILDLAGAGSLLTLDGNHSGEAGMAIGASQRADGQVGVRDGAELRFAPADAWQRTSLNIGVAGGVGRLDVTGGGRVTGVTDVNVGNGGDAHLLIADAGSLLSTRRGSGTLSVLNVGVWGTGLLEVRSGGQALASALAVGNGFDHGTSWGEVAIDGSGSNVVLDGVSTTRLAINNGTVRVSGGGLLDGTAQAADCSGQWCGVYIASYAGDTGRLTVTGSGSRASFLHGFNVGVAHASAPPATGYTLGNPGAATLGQVEVLAGGRLDSGPVSLARGPNGAAADGTETVFVQARVRGAGSVWSITNPGGGSSSFSAGLGNAANTLTDIQISDGGQLLLSAEPTAAAFVQLGADGGLHRMSISGAGSRLTYGTTNNAGFWIGRNGATASLAISNGGAIEGINRLQVSNTGATGTLSVDGSGSRIDYHSRFADLFVGRQGGVGTASVTRGGVVSLDAWQPRLYVGSGDGVAGTVGALRIDGAGSLVSLLSPQSAAGAFDLPQANIGWGGAGTVDITAGGQLLVTGRGTSTTSQIAQTRMTIGQTITTGSGASAVTLNGAGTVNVSGAGSRLSVAGTDTVIYVGRNSGGSGTLNLSAGAALDTTLLNVGVGGGVGTLQANAASIALSGQHAGSPIGATLGIGLGTGSIGSVRLANGSNLSIANTGDLGSLLLVGGANSAPGGNGSLVVRASTVQISGEPSTTVAVFGYNGTGVASFENGSTLDTGSHSIVVGWKKESVGVLNVSGGSTVKSGYVGVGASYEGDGGVATLIVNDTSTLTAGTIEIGSRGYVGGTGTLVGNVINRGVFNPGNSPGTLHVQGSFTNQAGGRLVLEVESDGHGGFVTDQLVFDTGSTVDLGGVQIEFRFLGATDPNAFQASGGFGLDSFLSQGGTALDPALLAGASYSASSSAYEFTSFSFSATGGAVFQAQAVPEPGTWGLFVLGLGLVGWSQRRRSRA